MSFLARLRRSGPDAPVDLDEGFWLSEAAAFQSMIVSVPGVTRRRTEPLPVLLVFEAGRTGRVAGATHNRIVGLLPGGETSLCGHVRSGQRVQVAGQLRRHGGLWRVWAGPEPRGSWPEPATDELEPEEPRIFGIPVGRRDQRRSPQRSAPWALHVGVDSWDVPAEELDRVRGRIAQAEPGARVHLRIGGGVTVPILLDGVTRVTLTAPDGGPVEQLHPGHGPERD
ncbi:MAG: hypothetical protein ACTMIR_04315 [Cellulomonadaceae bacterium]